MTTDTPLHEAARPRKVCLCGSTRFKSAYEEALRAETLKGRIVLTVGLFGHAEGLDPAGDVKRRLDELHLRKIDDSDEVLVLNVGGYIGSSTRNEIAYAQARGKPVRYLEPPEAEPTSAPGLPAQEHYIRERGGHCLYCRAPYTELRRADPQPGLGVVTRHVRCVRCRRHWVDEYHLAYVFPQPGFYDPQQHPGLE